MEGYNSVGQAGKNPMQSMESDTKCARLPQVASCVDRLGSVTDQITHAVAALDERLGSVLSVPTPTPDGPRQKYGEMQVPLADQLNHRIAMLDEVLERVQDILRRVEL